MTDCLLVCTQQRHHLLLAPWHLLASHLGRPEPACLLGRSVSWSADFLVGCRSAGSVIGKCEKNTCPERKTLGRIGIQSTKSGTGEQFLLQDCMAKVYEKGVFVHTHQKYPLLQAAPRLKASRSGRPAMIRPVRGQRSHS